LDDDADDSAPEETEPFDPVFASGADAPAPLDVFAEGWWCVAGGFSPVAVGGASEYSTPLEEA
jgi:hypothetical protein